MLFVRVFSYVFCSVGAVVSVLYGEGVPHASASSVPTVLARHLQTSLSLRLTGGLKLIALDVLPHSAPVAGAAVGAVTDRAVKTCTLVAQLHNMSAAAMSVVVTQRVGPGATVGPDQVVTHTYVVSDTDPQPRYSLLSSQRDCGWSCLPTSQGKLHPHLRVLLHREVPSPPQVAHRIAQGWL